MSKSEVVPKQMACIHIVLFGAKGSATAALITGISPVCDDIGNEDRNFVVNSKRTWSFSRVLSLSTFLYCECDNLPDGSCLFDENN